jgi:hypothetical protein
MDMRTAGESDVAAGNHDTVDDRARVQRHISADYHNAVEAGGRDLEIAVHQQNPLPCAVIELEVARAAEDREIGRASGCAIRGISPV